MSFHPKAVVFRADSSERIGYGHIVRCKALAQQAASEGLSVLFVTSKKPGDRSDWLKDDSGIDVEFLPDWGRDGAPWSIKEEEDANSFLEVVRECFPDLESLLVVVDHYGASDLWESLVRRAGPKLLAIDDLPNRKHDADYLLDQNTTENPTRFRELVPGHCRVFQGPLYSLLRPEFWKGRPSNGDGSEGLQSILLAFGGVDRPGVSVEVVKQLAQFDAVRKVEIIGGPDYPHEEVLESLKSELPFQLMLHRNPEDIPEILKRSDLCIGAAGSGVWERCSLGVPNFCITVVENQTEIAREVERIGAGVWLNKWEQFEPEKVVGPLRELIKHPAKLKKLANRAFCHVDGRGAERLLNGIRNIAKRVALVTTAGGWLEPYVNQLAELLTCEGHKVFLLYDMDQVPKVDVCCYLSWMKITPLRILARARHNLVVHESDLPQGKGMSPLTWQILGGSDRIPVTLIEAVEELDAGDVYLQEWVQYDGSELIDELRAPVGELTVQLCRTFVSNEEFVVRNRRPQSGESSVYKRRWPEHSEVRAQDTIEGVFDLIRVSDNERYPVFFEHRGRRYRLKIEYDDRQLRPERRKS